jgi:Flp pilus assembly protein TadG
MFRLARDRKGEVEEAVITLPILVVVSFFIVNAALAVLTAAAAANAANYGARMGSVDQESPAAVASAAAHQRLAAASFGGSYSVSASGGGEPGSLVMVRVEWRYPNLIGGLLSMFGGGTSDWEGESTQYFRQEGW